MVELLLKRGANVAAKLVQYHTETAEMIELGPIGLAKRYQNDSVARLVERFGASDAKRVVGDVVKVLPPVEAIEELYDVPEVHEIVVTGPQDLESGIPQDDAEDSESLAGTDGEDEDDSDVSIVGSRSRKQSAVIVQADTELRRQSSLHGLGIGGGSPIDAEIQTVQDGQNDAIGSYLTTDKVSERASKESTVGPGLDEWSHVHPGSESPDPVVQEESRGVLEQLREGNAHRGADGMNHPDEIDTNLPESTPEKEPLGKSPSDTILPDHRSSSFPASPASLGDRFRRLVPRKAVTRVDCAASDGQPATAQATEEPMKIATECISTAGEQAADNIAPPGGDNGGARGFFSPKRLLSWMSDGSDGAKQLTPTREESKAPRKTQGAVQETSSEQSTPNSQKPVQSASSPASDSASKPGRFGSRRVFSWKTTPGDGGIPKDSSPVALADTAEEIEEIRTQDIDVPEPKLGEINKEKLGLESVEADPPSSALEGQASRGGWSLSAKKSFGLRKAAKD